MLAYPVRKKFRDRAWTVFERSVGQIEDDFKAMMTDHAAKGLLKSGATIKAAIKIFEERTGQALDSTLSEASKLIEHRGRKWTAAMAGIGDALAQHLGRASDVLQTPLRAAGSSGTDAAAKRANELIGEAGTRLQSKLADFRVGWAAPSAKHWKDRLPLLYAIVLLVITALIAVAPRLPTEVPKVIDQFSEWYGEYDAWKGYWTNAPGGDVDAAPLKLSKEDFRVLVDETAGGVIAGTIQSRGICEKIPYHEEFLFEGTISSAGRAKIKVFNHIEGYKRVLAKLTLRRDGDVMTIIPDDDPFRVFAKETRIALDLNAFMENYDREPLCGKKSEEFMMDVVNKVQQQELAGKAAK